MKNALIITLLFTWITYPCKGEIPIKTNKTLYSVITMDNYCIDFQDKTPGSLQTNNTSNHVLLLDNWNTRCGNLQYKNNGMDGANDNYLFVDDGPCSDASSWMWNNADYNGDWAEHGCFCYDFNIFKNGGSSKPANSLYIYAGSDPFNATILARFKLYNPPKAGDGWMTYCSPVGLVADDGPLPQSSVGAWEIVKPAGGNGSDWNTLITNVSGVAFPMDIGQGSEEYGYDDICIKECEEDEVCTTCIPPCQNPTLVINTGYNPQTGNAISNTPGVQDPYWTLVEGPPVNGPINVGGPAFIINKNNAWTSPSSNSQYISAFQTNSANATNLPITGLAPYTFKRSFCVSEDDTELTFNIGLHVDNAVKVYLVDQLNNRTLLDERNCETNCNNIFCCPQANFNGPLEQLSISPITVAAGNYSLEFEVRNNGISMGLNVEGSISGAFLDTDACCQTTGFITGYKYHDENCNGIVDKNETVLSGWDIEVRNNEGNLIATSTTDQLGYYSIEVPEGNYWVMEVMQTNWRATNPIGGKYEAVKVLSSSITQLDFINCMDDSQNDPNCDPESPVEVNNQFQVDNGDIYITDPCHGVILTSPNGYCYRLTVGDDGSMQSVKVDCPEENENPSSVRSTIEK